MYTSKNQHQLIKDLSNCIRVLTADAIEQAKSGHPGMPLGMADVMTILTTKFLKYVPHNPRWFNRDRLILSAGHGSMLLYAFYYLAGYKDFGLDDIKRFRQLNSKTAGHPEYGHYCAIETTTGPLGQGLANAVGMAIAEKKYKAQLGKKICDHKIYCIVGDGCLMEGISYEAASLAGHLQLDNLIILFDDNKISIDGSTSLAVSENHLQKFQAFGFDSYNIDGYDYDAINDVLSQATKSDKPSFIACKTIIGKGSKNKAASHKSHGAPLGTEEIKFLKANIDFATNEAFYIPQNLKEVWAKVWEFNQTSYEDWQKEYSNLHADQKSYLRPQQVVVPKIDHIPTDPEATRVSAGKIINRLMQSNSKIICGSADLASSNNLINDTYKPITKDNYSGNFIHYGVREHAMGGIMNGLALSGFNPIGGTFFIFSDYMRPAIRLACLMKLPVIYIMTHDSIGVGEDGSTHQPVEHLASFRAMPNLTLYRPANYKETYECFQNLPNDKPSMFTLSRQKVPQLNMINCKRNDRDDNDIDILIFATGSEVHLAYEVKTILEKHHNLSTHVISAPSFDLLETTHIPKAKLKVAIEAGTSFGWHKIIGDNGIFCGIETFGTSAPQQDAYKHFNLDVQSIISKITGLTI